MSKAFLRESDHESTDDQLFAPAASLPPESRNSLTPDGAERLRTELRERLEREWPALRAAGDEGDAKRDLRRLEHRLRHLEQSLRTAEIISPPPAPHDTVGFGARVTLREPDGSVCHYRIVGADELAFGADHISAHSPLARSLLHARVGQHVSFRAPRGIASLQVLAISYPPAEFTR